LRAAKEFLEKCFEFGNSGSGLGTNLEKLFIDVLQFFQ
jgi:hypothetical protein